MLPYATTNKHRKSLQVFFYFLFVIIIYGGIIGHSNILEYIWIILKLGI
jgi:hypothetical protein